MTPGSPFGNFDDEAHCMTTGSVFGALGLVFGPHSLDALMDVHGCYKPAVLLRLRAGTYRIAVERVADAEQPPGVEASPSEVRRYG